VEPARLVEWRTAGTEQEAAKSWADLGLGKLYLSEFPAEKYAAKAANGLGSEFSRMLNAYPVLRTRNRLQSFEVLHHGTILASGAEQGGIAQSAGREIVVNKGGSILAWDRPAVGGGAWSTGESFLGMSRHEFGHSVWHALEKEKQGRWTSLFKEKGKPWWREGVSEYSGKSRLEAFSESFGAITHKRYVRGTLPAEVEDFFFREVLK